MVATNMKQHQQHQQARKVSAAGAQVVAAETVSIGSAKSAKSSGSSIDNNNTTLTPQSQSQTGNSSCCKTAGAKVNSRQSSQESVQEQKANILNVAEMLLHGVADNEILDIWLRSIQCEQFLNNFVNAGYDMPTISRITPQDLTAIGVTDPTKRLKILTEIKKLNLQDGIPDFKPASLSHWLSLIRLDRFYYQSLCDQQVDTIEKACQLTWEDFEELGITRLGHQKRFQLAIERVKEVDSNASKRQTKPMSEPIYDTNPSQILLVASAENHSMNGPIINKQSSTSELSSTGSGSVHSVYSAASAQYYQSQSNYGPLPTPLASSASTATTDNHQRAQQQPASMEVQRQQPPCNNTKQQQQQQAIYNQPVQPPPPIFYQHQHHPNNLPSIQQQQCHYQHPQIHQHPHLPTNQMPFQPDGLGASDTGINGTMMHHQQTSRNRQSMSQLPLAALSRLPLHQQQLLQQGSIYATLSRQPSTRPKQPPPVPMRTNSLKPTSLEPNPGQLVNNNYQHPIHQAQQQQQLGTCNAPSTTSLFKNGSRVTNLGQVNSHQTMLSKNKSFSGGANMEASRARFMNRGNQLQQQSTQLINQNKAISNQNSASNQDFIYGLHDGSRTTTIPNTDNNMPNMLLIKPPTVPTTNNNTNTNTIRQSPNHQPISFPNTNVPSISSQSMITTRSIHQAGGDFDPQMDTRSAKSVILSSSNSLITNSPVDSMDPLSGSGSSQTLYNSVSNGSNDLNMFNHMSQSVDQFMRAPSTASNCTLNRINPPPLDTEATPNYLPKYDKNLTTSINNGSSCKVQAPTHILPTNSVNNNNNNKSSLCSATLGQDDDFPPPPSPLSSMDSEEHGSVSLSDNSSANFMNVNHGLMTFRVGI